MKIILFLCKLFKISVFEYKDNSFRLITKHAVRRAEQRLQYKTLLEIATQTVLSKGTKAIHFEYVNNQRTEYAKLYNGYIWVFDKAENRLITVYVVSKAVDLLVTRK